jgi:hypothetical protein
MLLTGGDACSVVDNPLEQRHGLGDHALLVLIKLAGQGVRPASTASPPWLRPGRAGRCRCRRDLGPRGAREAVFRLLLQSRSLRLALIRYHLTTPTALRGNDEAAAQTRVLRDQLNLLTELDKADFDRFSNLGDDQFGARLSDGDAP